jgi:hypothetical protein
MEMHYVNIPILDVARRCGIEIDARTLGKPEVEARCPFCGDKPQSGRHLYMNTERNQYICFLCGTKGNSVSLYANLRRPPISYGEAARELLSNTNAYTRAEFREKPRAVPTAKPVRERHAVYSAMLASLALDQRHIESLRFRGFSDDRAARNMYRSLPRSENARLVLARMLTNFYDLSGIPGFYRTKSGAWSVAGEPGLLIPVRNKDELIQGMQIRTDDAGAKRKYRWLSSADMRDGTGSGSPVHITGDPTQSIAYVTEGPLKGDTASFLDGGNALFVCVAGVNAIRGLKEAVLSLGVKHAVVAFDMDRFDNQNVGKAANNVVRELSRIKNLKVAVKNWDAAYNGIDDYYLGRRLAAA